MASNITKGAVISYIAIVINIAISFIYTPWMIHTIGKSDYGLYSLVTAFVSYFLLDFGLNSSITRFVAKYRAIGDEDGVSAIIGLTARVFLIIDAVIFVALFLMFFFIEKIFTGLNPSEIETLRGLYIIAGFFSVFSFALKPIDGIMMAYEYFVPNKVLDMIHRVGSVILVVVLLLLGGDVYSLVLVHCGTAFLASLAKCILFRRKSRIRIKWSYSDKGMLKALLSFSVWIFLIGLAQRLRLSFVPTVLGIKSNSSEIAVFSLGMMIEGLVWTISNALNGLFLPKVTRLVAKSNEPKSVSELMIRVGRIQYFIVLLIFTGFCLFGDVFIKCWVGEDFSDAYYVIIFLILPSLITNTQSIANDVIYAENKVRYTAPIIISTSLVGLVLSFFFAPKYGAIGCAICSCAALLLYVLIVNFYYISGLKLHIVSFFYNCHLRISVPMLLSLVFGILLRLIFQLQNWHQLFAGVIIYCLAYFANAYFLAFNPEEKKLLSSIINF